MQSMLAATLVVVALLMVQGCGDSLGSLNQRAAGGSIHEDAPVTTHLQIQIAAPPAKVWALLVDASSWPTWQKQIESVAVAGTLRQGTDFVWKNGGTTIRSQVQLFEPEHRLAWTGTAMTAKAIHLWELQPRAGNQTLLIMKESLDGPLMAQLYPSQKLAEADTAWMAALKRAAEATP